LICKIKDEKSNYLGELYSNCAKHTLGHIWSDKKVIPIRWFRTRESFLWIVDDLTVR